jgi:hypothetical protein
MNKNIKTLAIAGLSDEGHAREEILFPHLRVFAMIAETMN